MHLVDKNRFSYPGQAHDHPVLNAEQPILHNGMGDPTNAKLWSCCEGFSSCCLNIR